VSVNVNGGCVVAHSIQGIETEQGGSAPERSKDGANAQGYRQPLIATVASLAAVTDTTGQPAVSSFRARPSRRNVRVAAITAVLAAVALAGALGAQGGSHRSPAPARRNGPRAAARPGSATSGSGSATGARAQSAGAAPATGARAIPVAEVRDPEEARSYPAPASVKHAAAATPRKAGEAVIAAGAPSDAEVRAELAQMKAAERSARQQQAQRLAAVPGGQSIGGNGTLPIPPNVPEAVQRVIAGANEIADFPYLFGGGHASFVDNAYDCSGSVSYALAAGGLIGAPETSGELESWGAPGPGRYITVLANAGHTYMYVDGIMYNTAGRSGVYASRWQVGAVNNAGFVVRHWPGL
jgi:cell wall-associated NlpC family hydrolase